MKNLTVRFPVLIVVAAWFVVSNSSLLAADRVRIGLSSFTPINGALWIAEEKGLFKKQGIDC